MVPERGTRNALDRASNNSALNLEVYGNRVMGRGFAIDWEGRELLVGERENWWAKGRISKPEGGMVGEREDRWTTGKTGGREGRLVGEREDWWASGKTGGREGRLVGEREDWWATGSWEG